jgi:putative peptide zinc metalloprotease protein
VSARPAPTVAGEDTITIAPDPVETRAGAPRLAEGVELIGEYEGSGFKEAPSLVRRVDGQVIQLTPLLFSVASNADGQRSEEEIAELVGRELGRSVTADNIRFLIDEKLHPLGVLTATDGSRPKVKKLDPLLALRFKAAVFPERAAGAVATVFKPLFFPPVILGVLAAFIALDVWLFGTHGIAQGLRGMLYEPGLILLMFAMVVLSAALHEIGHATGCSYGGAAPGKMGCGLYLAWPAFYTDVTDAYRLDRRGRLRTDLGGVYFNIVFCLLTFAVYLATGAEFLLLVIVFQHFEMVHQLLPLVRLDGYYIVADLTGVPDLFNRIKPILTSALPWRWGRPSDEVQVLKPWVRVAVTAWVLMVVPLLLFQLFMLLLHLPRILGTAWDSLGQQASATSAAFGDGNALGGIAGIVQIIALTLPIVGILLMLVRIAGRMGKSAWSRTEGKPFARGAAVIAVAGLTAALAAAWIPSGNYTPIRPGERGTIGDGMAAVRDLATGQAPLASQRRADATTDSDGAGPTSAEPGAKSSTTTTSSTATTSTTAQSTTATTSRTSLTTARPTATTARPTTTTAGPTTTTTVQTTSTTAPTTSTTAGQTP